MLKYTLEAKDVVLEVVDQDTSRGISHVRLLNGISAEFKSGEMSIIMGPGGCGKTTFVSLLAGRVDPRSRTCGSVLFKGKERNPRTWLNKLSYLEQDDCIVPGQTVEECIRFAATCRTTRKQRKGKNISEITEDLMRKLHINDIRHMKMESVSGSERKRTLISAELAAGVEVLILDEATSGFDSCLALNLVHLLKSYASAHNIIVIIIIHQPGPGLFSLFDFLLFLNKGSIIFSGKTRDCENFLSSRGISVHGCLSVCEMLFEVFSGKSVIPEIKAYDDVVKSIEEKMDVDRRRIVRDVPESSGNVVILHSFDVYKSILILSRHIIIEWRNGFTLKRVVFDALLFWFLISFLGFNVHLFLMSAWEKISFRRDSRFLAGLNYNGVSGISKKEAFDTLVALVDKDLQRFVLESLKYGTASLFFFVSCGFSNNTLLDNSSYIHREMKKGLYGVFTLHFAIMLVDIERALLKTLIFFVVLHVSQVTATIDVFSLYLALYSFIGSFLMTYVCTLIKIINSGVVFRTFLYSFACLTGSFGKPLYVYFIRCLLDNFSFLKSVSGWNFAPFLFRIVVAFWPYAFFEAFMNIGVIERWGNPSYHKGAVTEEYLDLVHSGIIISNPPFLRNPSFKSFLEIQHTFLFDSLKGHSKYLQLLFLFVSITFVFLAGTALLAYKYSPRLRTKLSVS